MTVVSSMIPLPLTKNKSDHHQQQPPLARPNSAAYGIRAIQDLRQEKGRDPLTRSRVKLPVPGSKVESRSQEAHRVRITDYFLEKVDPLLSACITHLLLSEPAEDVAGAMLDYFTVLASGVDKVPLEVVAHTKAEQKQYLTHRIGPVVSRLISALAVQRPADVLPLLLLELRRIRDDPLSLSSPSLVPAPAPGPDYHTTNNNGSSSHLPHIQHKNSLPDHSHSSSSSKTLSQQHSSSIVLPVLPQAKHVESSHPAVAVAADQTVGETSGAASVSRNIQILVVGLDGGGKTTIVNSLQGNFDAKIRPTIGFRPVCLSLDEHTHIKFYDVGGGPRIRDIWCQYYHDVHGVLFVVDASADPQRTAEAREVFTATIASSFLKDKPLLVFANKQDQPGARSVDEVRADLGLDVALPGVSVMGCAGLHPGADSSEAEVDPRIEAGVEWLLHAVQERYDLLQRRVAGDSKLKELEESRKRLERERKVLRNKIAGAFFALMDPALLAEMPAAEPAKPDDLFSQQEAVDFLASEIGQSVQELDPVAVELCGMVGFQRLALSIVGGLYSPVSKKKAPMTWAQIRELIADIRLELKLT